MHRDWLDNPVTADAPETAQGISDFVEGFLAYETKAVNVLAAAEADPANCLANAYAGALHLFLESPAAPGLARPWLDKAAALAITPVHIPNTSKGKNASDIALVIDALDLLHGGRLDGFVLVSSDGDFTRLAQRIREQGVDVWGVGNANTPPALRMACKRFVTVENLVSDDSGQKSDKSSGKSRGDRNDLNRAYQMIANALSDSDDPDGWATLSWLGRQVTQRYPDFDPRSFGHKRLTDLVRAIDKLESSRDGSEHRVRVRP